MKATHVHKLYQDVSATERFRLAVAADARADTAERDHLVATCPRLAENEGRATTG